MPAIITEDLATMKGPHLGRMISITRGVRGVRDSTIVTACCRRKHHRLSQKVTENNMGLRTCSFTLPDFSDLPEVAHSAQRGLKITIAINYESAADATDTYELPYIYKVSTI
jgi:hypothetical protein